MLHFVGHNVYFKTFFFGGMDDLPAVVNQNFRTKSRTKSPQSPEGSLMRDLTVLKLIASLITKKRFRI